MHCNVWYTFVTHQYWNYAATMSAFLWFMWIEITLQTWMNFWDLSTLNLRCNKWCNFTIHFVKTTLNALKWNYTLDHRTEIAQINGAFLWFTGIEIIKQQIIHFWGICRNLNNIASNICSFVVHYYFNYNEANVNFWVFTIEITFQNMVHFYISSVLTIHATDASFLWFARLEKIL